MFVSKFQKFLHSDLIKDFKSRMEKIGEEETDEKSEAVKLFEKKLNTQYEIPESEEWPWEWRIVMKGNWIIALCYITAIKLPILIW